MIIIKNYTFLKFIENINKEEKYTYKIDNISDSKKLKKLKKLKKIM